ncbi:hypothetical protein [Kangiella sp. TOML190]|uniref:hypothetical protein n=1 Tax=Kangiella sp. TOML190 TaxID=2931351 RepID=UPI00203BB7ED|nr:hypothetical protein [Kangiella sp. TOML190]
MKTITQGLLVYLLMPFFGSTVIASTPTWHSSKIKRVYPLANGDIVITFQEQSSACTNGNSPKYHYLAVAQNGVTAEGLNNMLSVVLTAATTQKAVNINFDADTSACYINRLYVNFE